jgi:hypothetical protein
MQTVYTGCRCIVNGYGTVAGAVSRASSRALPGHRESDQYWAVSMKPLATYWQPLSLTHRSTAGRPA